MQQQQKYDDDDSDDDDDNDNDGDESNTAKMQICWQCGMSAQKLSGEDKLKFSRLAVLPNICFEFISPTLLYGWLECMPVT